MKQHLIGSGKSNATVHAKEAARAGGQANSDGPAAASIPAAIDTESWQRMQSNPRE